MGLGTWFFSLTDETYSLLCGMNIPKELNEKQVFFYGCGFGSELLDYRLYPGGHYCEALSALTPRALILR